MMGEESLAAVAADAEGGLCFCPGTRILTACGERAIETLAIGDLVVTQQGAHARIIWIGRRSYDATFVASNTKILPVCIKAGALGEGLPQADLWVSPGHGLLIDGALVPAWRLINGCSILQPAVAEGPVAGSVDYLHIELAEHDVLFAEGVPAESFIDHDVRGQFQNSAEYDALYPNAGGKPSQPCAATLHDGWHLHAIQRRINARAGLPLDGPSLGPLRGFVDIAGPDRVAGWVQDLEAPHTPVALDIILDGRRVLRVLANRYRVDLQKAGIGNGCYAFEADLPPGLNGFAEVRRSSDQTPLNRTTQAAMAAAA